MSHIVIAIDVHKRMLAVVAGDAATEGEVELQCRKYGVGWGDLRLLIGWLTELNAKEIVMESTAPYWRPVGQALEGQFHLELAQAQSNRGPKGRKSDFRDAERLWRRYDADELILSYVPDPEQRLWRTLSRTRIRLTRDKSRLQNRLEALLEEMHIQLSGVVSDLLGVSARRMLRAIAAGEKDVERLAEMADVNLRATKAELCDVLQSASKLDPRYRLIRKQFLERVDLNESHSQKLKEALAESLKPYGGQVERVAEIPGMGTDSAQQVIAEVGIGAEKFASAADLSSWVGVCPGENVSAEKSSSDRSAKGNAAMRRILDQAANAAVKAKGTVFEKRFRRILGRDAKKYAKAIWAVAHHICRVIWKILHDGVRYEERGDRRDPRADKRRATRLTRELKALGYSVVRTPVASEARA